MSRTSRKASSPQVRPAESDEARLTNQRAEESRMDDALPESEERFRSLYENTIDGILLMASDGSILAANPEACRLLGRTEQEICAAGQAGIFDSSDPLLPAMLWDRAATGKVRGELTMIRGDGSRFRSSSHPPPSRSATAASTRASPSAISRSASGPKTPWPRSTGNWRHRSSRTRGKSQRC